MIDNQAKKNEVSLKELIFSLRSGYSYFVSNWKFILIAGIVGSSIGLLVSILTKPIYKAELSFALEDEKSGGMGGLGAAMGLASQFGLDLGAGGGGGVFSGDNLLTLMQSRSMVEKTLLTPVNANGRYQTLAEMYITFNEYHDKWAGKPKLAAIKYLPNANRSQFSLQQDSILGVFYKKIIEDNLVVDKVDKKLSIITVVVKSKNELFSKLFSEILVRTVSNFYITTKTKRSVQNVGILQKQTDSVRRELNAALSGVASSADNNPNSNPALQILRVPSQRRQVDVQANQAILTQLVANLELSKVSLRKETPLIQIIDKPILPLEQERISKSKGILIGGFVSAMLFTIYLFMRRFLNNVIE